MDDIMNITVYNRAYIWVYLLNAKLWVRPKAKLEMHIKNAHIRSVNFGWRWLCLIRISLEKLNFTNIECA